MPSLLSAESDFGLALLRETEEDKSVVISPFSIGMALALVHAGAKGQTKEQIREGILKGATDEELASHFSQLAGAVMGSEQVKVLVANRMYIKQGFEVLQSYLDDIKRHYAAQAEVHDFSQAQACSDHANRFVSDVTHGMIKDFISPDMFGGDAVALLLNAVYLDAKWLYPFDADKSRQDDFHLNGEEVKKVTYLQEREVNRLYGETEEAQILTLEYEDKAFTFTIILPKERNGLAKLRANLTGEKLQGMLKSVGMTYLNLRFPKFKIEKELDLVGVLKTLGMEDMFNDQVANLRGIAPDALYVSGAKHKAVIEVDEKGVKAAAATVVVLACRSISIKPKPIEFKADRPFLFLTAYKGQVLFVGNYCA